MIRYSETITKTEVMRSRTLKKVRICVVAHECVPSRLPAKAGVGGCTLMWIPTLLTLGVGILLGWMFGDKRGKAGASPGFRYFVLLICGFWCIIRGINPSLAFHKGCASTERFLYKFESGPHRSLEAALVFEKPKSR